LNARGLFVGEDGRLRALWRVVAFAAILLVSFVVTAGLAGPVVSWVLRLIGASGVANEAWLMAIALVVATAICLRAIDKRPWSDVWLDRGAARPQLLVVGFAFGALAIALPIVALIGSGWLRSASSPPGSWWGAFFRISVMLVPAALSEELLTRGYIMSVLRESWGWFWAIAATSIGFGLLHLQNPGATAGSVALVTLAGFFLAAVVYSTRSLYSAWMAHFAWNWTMAVIFHASVSGLPMEAPGYRYVDAGPDWATGGEWGPEGGLVAAAGMVGGIALMLRRRPHKAASQGSELDASKETA
jgi:membrane protease YdiL (CAAX protease family)